MKRQIVILLHSNVGMLDLASVLECLRCACEIAGEACYSVTTCAVSNDPQQADEPWITWIPLPSFVAAPSTIDTLIIPDGAPITLKDHDLQTIEFLAKRTPYVRRLAAIGHGVLLAAAAGVTRTHTVVADCDVKVQLAALCSQTIVEPHLDLHKSGKIWTARGASAALALTLSLIEEDLGRIVASEVTQRFKSRIAEVQTGSGTRPPLEPTFDHGSPVERVQDWVMANPSADLRVEQLSEMVAMSEKTLTRAFKRKTGRTVGEFVLSARLSYACELLQLGERKIKDVARLSGLGSQSNMRQLFIARFGCSPSAYREFVLRRPPSETE